MSSQSPAAQAHQPATAQSGTRRVPLRALLAVGILVSLLLAGVVSYYASGSPDGLEFVAEKTGFIHSATDHASSDSPFADYATRGVDNPRLSGGLAGVVGATLVFLLAGGLFLLVRRRGSADPGAGADPDGGTAPGAVTDSNVIIGGRSRDRASER